MRAESLEKIELYRNDIGPDGCLALIEANWAKISAINLGNYISTKARIKLEMKDADNSQICELKA